MPQLGLGLGLDKSSQLKSLAQLVKSAGGVLYLDARKADGVNRGINSPFTNPLIDLANSVGKNLFDVMNADTTINGAGVTREFFGNGIKVKNSLNNASASYTNFIYKLTLLPNTQYRVSATRTVVSGGPGIIDVYADGGGWIGDSTFTTPANGKVAIRFYANFNTSGIGEVNFTNIQLELGNTATAYEPYKKNNALLQSFAGTQTDGYTLEATVNSNGQAVGYENSTLNPSFENDLNDWQNNGITVATIDTTIFKYGLKSIKFSVSASSGEYKQEQTFPIGKRIYTRAECYIQSRTSGTPQLSLSDINASTNFSAFNFDVTKLGQWQSVSTIRTTITSGQRLRINPATGTSTIVVNFDGIISINLDDNPLIQALETSLGRQLTVAECDRIFPFVATTGVTLVSARPYLATEGLDSLAVLANNPSVDIVGTEDFEIHWCGITPATLQAGYLLNKNTDTITLQYGLYFYADGRVETNTSNSGTTVGPAGTLKPNTQTKVDIERKDGRLKCWVNDVLTYDQPNTTALVSQPFLRLFARSTNVGGISHASYFKGLTAYLILARGTYGDLDKLDGVLDKVARDYR